MATSPKPPLASPQPPLPDQRDRERALATDASFIVRAPAGSGKTELLVSRFLALLAVVDQPEQILAVTFTRKAAAEMRRRVLEALTDGAGDLARRARQRAADCGWDLLATPARLHISTLDSLALALTTRMPWLSRLGAVPQPVDDATPLYRAAAHAVLTAPEASVAEAARHLLLRLDNDVERAEDELASLLPHRDQWLPLILGDIEADLRARVEATLRAQVEAELAACRAQLLAAAPHTAATWWPEAASDALPQWHELAAQFLTKEGALRKKPAPPFSLPPDACAALDRVRSLAPLWMDEPAWSRLTDLRLLLPRAVAELRWIFRERGVCDFPELTLAAGAALQSDGAPTALAFAFDAQLRHLLVDEFQDTSTAQCHLLLALMADWQPGDGRTLFLVGDPMQSIYRFRDARVDLFLRAATGTLGHIPLEPLRLKANFRSQQNLVAWCNQLFRAVFPAGEDPDAGRVAFHDAHPMRAPDMPHAELHLLRTAAEEAARVAELVQQELAASPTTEIAVLVHAHTHLGAILPALRARKIPYQGMDLATLADSPIASDLAAIARALVDPCDRIAWLALLRAPWCALQLNDLEALAGGDAPDAAPVAELLATRAALLSDDGRQRATKTIQIVAQAAAERGRCGLRALTEWCWQRLEGAACATTTANPADAEALLAGLDRLESGNALVDAAAIEQMRVHRYAPPDPRATRRVQVMTVHRAKGLQFDVVLLPGLARNQRSGDAPLLRWREWDAAGRGGRAARTAGDIGAENRGAERGDPPALRSLGEAGPPENEGERRTCVVHRTRPDRGSRGPQPGRASSGVNDAVRRLRAQPRQAPRQSIEAGFALAARAGRGDTDAAYQYLAKLDAERDEHEKLRVLYVAATRAKQRLHLLAVPPHRNGAFQTPYRNTPLGRLWPALKATLPDGPAPAEDYAVPAPAPLRRLRSLAPSPSPALLPWQPAALAPPPSEAAHAPHFASALHRRVGIAVHAMLQIIAGTEPLAWSLPRLERELRRAGIVPAAWAEARALATAALDRTLADTHGRWILSPHEDQHNEWPLTGLVAGVRQHATLDRSFVDRGVRWVIDYKTAHHQGAGLEAFLDRQLDTYRPQLQAYAALLAGLDPHPIRCALFFPLLAVWRELPE